VRSVAPLEYFPHGAIYCVTVAFTVSTCITHVFCLCSCLS
jgi:hypothetical protein